MTILIDKALQGAVYNLFERLERHGCAPPWGQDVEECKRFQFDSCAALSDGGITAEDIARAYGALMAMECIRFKRWPSNREILDVINARRPDNSQTAIAAEGMGIFQRIVGEIEAGRARGLEARVREAYGIGASEALAAIGGLDRLTEEGAREYLGAARNLFEKAYSAAVQAGRGRGDALKALPPPRALGSLPAARQRGPTPISGMFEDLKKTLMAEEPK